MNALLSAALRLTLLALPLVTARAITVSGRIAEADGAPVAGVAVTIEQIGGELPPFKAVTAADGTYQVSDALLFGNIRVTPASTAFSFTPARRDAFTDGNLGGQDFAATGLNGGDIAVASEAGVVLRTPATLTLPSMAFHTANLVRLALRNPGTTALTNLAATFSGPQADEFSISGVLVTGLAPGATGVVTIAVQPVALGKREATLSLTSSDPNENPFLVKLTTTVVSLDVTTTADAGLGSLREAFANAALVPGQDVLGLDPSLSGQTIRLLSPIVVNDPDGVWLEAQQLEAGLVLSGDSTNRHFIIAGGTAGLLGVRLVDGSAPFGGDFSGRGGSILNLGTLQLISCHFEGNSAISRDGNGQGGAVYNEGSLDLQDCVLSTNVTDGFGGALGAYGVNVNLAACRFEGNQAWDGGAVDGDGVYAACTFTGNVAARDGGAVTGFGEFSGCVFSANEAAGSGGALAGGGLFQRCAFVSNRAQGEGGGVVGGGLFENCTFHDNQAGTFGGGFAGDGQFFSCTVAGNRAVKGVGGLHLNGGGGIRVKNCIVAGNVGNPADVQRDALDVQFLGANLIGDLAGSGLTEGPTVLTGDPRLAPVDNYGGNTLTMAIRPGSPALNAGKDNDLTTDQRGYPIVAERDLGAYEAGTILFNANAYSWELIESDDPAVHAPAFDFDGDGVSNHDEFTAWTDATDPTSFFRFSIEPHEEHVHIELWGAPGRLYTLMASAVATGPWEDAGLPPAFGQAEVITFTAVRNEGQRFFRVVVEYEE